MQAQQFSWPLADSSLPVGVKKASPGRKKRERSERKTTKPAGLCTHRNPQRSPRPAFWGNKKHLGPSQSPSQRQPTTTKKPPPTKPCLTKPIAAALSPPPEAARRWGHRRYKACPVSAEIRFTASALPQAAEIPGRCWLQSGRIPMRSSKHRLRNRLRRKTAELPRRAVGIVPRP